MKQRDNKIYMLALTALFIALSYIGTMFNIPFAIGGAKTMVHLGNVFCLLGALVLGGKRGGLAASIGMGAFDLLNGWVLYAPSTIVLKFCIALITGTLFDSFQKKKMNLPKSVLLSTMGGMLFNVVFSPIASFLTSTYLIGTEVGIAKIVASWQSIAVFVNAGIAISVASALYLALYPVISKNVNLHR